MSEVGARILRPGATTSFGVRSQSKSSFVPPTSYSSLGNNIRQIFPSPRESNVLSDFKNNYQIMMNNVASFLSHNNTTSEFRSQFNLMINEMDALYNTFIINLPRTSSSALKSARSAKSQNGDKFLQSFLPFLKQFAVFSKAMRKIRQSGNDPIHEAIDMHFTIVSDCLETIRKNSTSVTGIHDAAVRKSKTLKNQLMNLKRKSILIIQEGQDTTKITTDIRNFSRVLNDSFTSEFAESPLGPTALEKLRSDSYTSCCAIIHSVREAGMFDSHSSQMFEAYDNFRYAIQSLLDKNGVEKNLGELVDCDTEDIEQITIRFNRDASLPEILQKGTEVFEDKKVLEFIEIIHDKSTAIINENDELKKKISEYENIRKEIKQARAEKEAACKIAEDSKREYEEMKKILDENNKKMEEYDKNAGADTQFRRALTESIPHIASFLNEDVPEMETDRKILIAFRNLLKGVLGQKCQRCVQFLERERRLVETMTAYIEPDEDIEKMMSTFVKIFRENQMNLKSRSMECSQANILIGSQRESFFKILALFNVSQSKAVDIGEYTYNTVKENLDQMKRSMDGIADQKSSAQQEFVADLMKRLKSILETEQTESIESYLDQIENNLRQAEQDRLNNKVFLNSVSERLYQIIKKEKKTNPIIQNEVNDALDDVQDYINNIESIPKEKETVNVVDYALIADKLSKILEKEVDRNNEDAVLQAVDEINNDLTSTKKKLKTTSNETVKYKEEIVEIVKKLQNFLNQPSNVPEDLEKLVESADILIKQLLAQRKDMKLSDITKMFEPIFQYMQSASQTDPFSFIPEFVSEFEMIEGSVQSLKPFALILNNIFTNFDCQFSSFDPKSQSYNYLKGQLNQLHQTLNSMSAAKTHNLIFLILSRFVTFISSISSALAMAYESKSKPA
ncbi:hypothetical protein TVAG_010630 [Trichomonas vaginalis G3]|uniref:Uncharacterized protein n=1 Tax=Trichomonas vaginalis (strain ATCC PRA-98 / G3) TaxID=412133 RepID=A2DNZ0_TRIV3|nr:WD40 repeat-containing protein [Trichomonas vaginalis G3]EAY17839.1 hypothetical protein TVAG_010630 [Trichomonas vaginalis G3]KAI5489960.1 WD40 repeat-containing protein [Trichomonas vaginalis G3]|eukprot:XP_001329974.1 hypothetical protein [Trichomonas vaginalis G3]